MGKPEHLLVKHSQVDKSLEFTLQTELRFPAMSIDRPERDWFRKYSCTACMAQGTLHVPLIRW